MRKLAWFCGGFALACLMCCYGAAGLYRLLAAVFGMLSLVSLALWSAPRRRPSASRVLPAARRALALCLGGLIASGWFWGWTALFRAPADALAGQSAELSGMVTTWPEETSIGGRSLTISLDGGLTAPDVLLYATGDWDSLRPGDRVRFTARLVSADRIRGDETTYYTAKGVFLLGYVSKPPEAALRPDPLPIRFWPSLCARALKQSLYAAFDPVAAPLAAALVTGDKSGLDEGLYNSLNRTGTSHAVVVSGMHISCLVAAAMALLHNRRRLAFTVIPLLLVYALMAGGTPSALRAVAMQAVLLCAPLARRENDAPTALSFALLVLLLLNPYAAASVSLQLSFTSMAGVLAAAPALAKPMLLRISGVRRRHAGRRGWALLCRSLRVLACSLSASLGAMLFSQPVLAVYFQRASLVFPLSNLLILWAVQLLLPAALLTGCLGLFLPGAARVLGHAFGLLARYVVLVVTQLGRWRFAALDMGNFLAVLCVAALYLFLVIWLLSRRDKPRLAVLFLCLIPIFAAALLLTRLPVTSSLLTVAALDVGQGSSTALLSGGRTCLIDCGGNGSRSAGDTAADYFASFGVARLDLLVLTHFDADHVNGLSRLFDRMDVRAVAIPAGAFAADPPEELLSLIRAEGAPLAYIDNTTAQPLGGAVLTLYPPMSGGASNEAGLFALCSAGDFDILVTGDADAFVERMLLKYCRLPDLELLVAGHHGAEDSTSAELLDALRPELALISVGWNNYGHPSPETLARLAGRGVQVFRTDQLGTVSVHVTKGQSGYETQIDTR